MFETKRDLFFPVELVPSITARPVQPNELWTVFGALEAEIFTPFSTLGAFEMPDERWENIKPLREVYSSTETSNGELGYYIVSDGTGVPYRIRIRPPSFYQLQTFPLQSEGKMLSDAVAVLSSLNVIAGELDR